MTPYSAAVQIRHIAGYDVSNLFDGVSMALICTLVQRLTAAGLYDSNCV